MKNAGFTMIELLVVLVILGLLAGLVGPRLFGKADLAKVQTAITQMEMIEGALKMYRLDVGRFPSSDNGLAALTREAAPSPHAIPATAPRPARVADSTKN